ncbi:MAG: TonB family protein [Bacteroidales bacterium]|nr:TonB family protein [Bacteroidales bacterium]
MKVNKCTKQVLSLAFVLAALGVGARAQSDTAAVFTRKNNTGAMPHRLSKQQIKELRAVEMKPEKAIAISPSYPGGEEALQAFLSSHLRYPEKASAEGIQGDVVVSFVVDTNGAISDIRIRKDIGGGCAPEAVRVVAEMPSWKPARNLQGKAIRAEAVVRVRFAIDNMIPEGVNLDPGFEDYGEEQGAESK